MQIRLEERPLHDVAQDRGLALRISHITAESYTNPEVLLGQEYQKNNQVYLVWSEESELIAFFMVGWSEIVLGNGPVPCVFLGLSAKRRKRDKDREKGTGIFSCGDKSRSIEIVPCRESREAWWTVVISTF